MTVELNRVHLQRLNLAVQAALAGGRIHFRVTSGEPRTIVWINERVPGIPHAIMNLWGRSDVWVNLIQQKFEEMLYVAKLNR